jgi:hypothetical protein
VPFLAYNEYKQKQYPVWNLLAELHAQGKLTPVQEVLCQPIMPEEELYDLQTDPWEIDNLARSDKPEHQAELKKLRGVLEKWIEDTNDQGRHIKTLEELQSVPQFQVEQDWRPAPGSKEAAEKPKPTTTSDTKAKDTKKKRKQRQ